MNLLAIDTSTTSTVLGLLHGKKIVDHTVVDVKKHSREILPAIATLMEKSDVALRDIDAIVFGHYVLMQFLLFPTLACGVVRV